MKHTQKQRIKILNIIHTIHKKCSLNQQNRVENRKKLTENMKETRGKQRTSPLDS